MDFWDTLKWGSIGYIRAQGYGLIVASLALIIFYFAVRDMKHRGRTGLDGLFAFLIWFVIIFGGIGASTQVLGIGLAVKNVKDHDDFTCPL